MQAINMQEVETAMNKYGDIVLTKNEKNNVIVLSVEQYKEKLLKAEKQIEEGKTVKATEVFKELEEKYGF